MLSVLYGQYKAVNTAVDDKSFVFSKTDLATIIICSLVIITSSFVREFRSVKKDILCDNR